MKKQSKKVFALGMAIILTLTNAFVVCAEDSTETLPTEAVYNLEQGGTQRFFIEDGKGEKAQVIIEEVIGQARIADNIYKATYAFLYKQAFINHDTGVIATISNSALRVTKK